MFIYHFMWSKKKKLVWFSFCNTYTYTHTHIYIYIYFFFFFFFFFLRKFLSFSGIYPVFHFVIYYYFFIYWIFVNIDYIFTKHIHYFLYTVYVCVYISNFIVWDDETWLVCVFMSGSVQFLRKIIHFTNFIFLFCFYAYMDFYWNYLH